MNYYRTLIAVADDCPAESSQVPPARGGKQTAATIQYELLAGRPHRLTQEDVLFETWLTRQNRPVEPPAGERAALRERFFAKNQPCLRASPLPKRYGFGMLFDAAGRVSLCPMESEGYQRVVAGDRGDVTVLKAFRSRRA